MENNKPAFAEATARQIKILIFSLAYHPFVGGAEVAIKEITDRLGDEFQFEMITANLDGRQKEEEQIGKVRIYRPSFSPPPYEGGGSGGRAEAMRSERRLLRPLEAISAALDRGEVKKLINKYLFPWLAYRKSVELQQKNNYDLIWAMMANQAGWAALKFKKKFPAVKYLLTLQEGDSELDIWLRTFLIRPIYKSIYHRADYIQAISGFLKKRAENLEAKCEVEVVPNGISMEHGTWNMEHNHEKIKRVITVSRLVKKNGIEDLIKSIHLLITSYQLPVTINIIGDGKLRSKLEDLVKKLKLEDQVKFLGNIPNQEVYSYLADADVFVRPSLSEGLGNAFLEAMAVGVPVIGTKVGGIPDFLADGETGWFCEVKNPGSIAEKIKYVLDEKNKDEVLRMIAKAKKNGGRKI